MLDKYILIYYLSYALNLLNRLSYYIVYGFIIVHRLHYLNIITALKKNWLKSSKHGALIFYILVLNCISNLYTVSKLIIHWYNKSLY
jgi:hypothetical protein